MYKELGGSWKGRRALMDQTNLFPVAQRPHDMCVERLLYSAYLETANKYYKSQK